MPKKTPELFSRHLANPILQAADLPYEANTIFNPGAVRLADGTTMLLSRVEDRRGHSHLLAARSQDGVGGWTLDGAPTLLPDMENHPEEAWGVEDARIVHLPELGKYAITYTSYSRRGPGLSLALTADFRTFERVGQVMPPENKDAALFPRRIGERWAMIHRPVNPMGAHMWLSFSPDLRHWGDHKLMLEARSGAWWDADKIGLSPPPLETEAGWLVLYHGVKQTCAGCLYRVGAALFDLDDPSRCLQRGDGWIFGPQEPYELFGDVGYVTFPCGLVLGEDGDTLHLYYGAADTCIALAIGSLCGVLAWLQEHDSL
jgi:predicted GH43/DUF377 family glycosyl hydrolase